jgi:RNA-directed DNA polymerase
MKESHGEGGATHTGPESCAGVREGEREALTGKRAGRVLSPERRLLRDADAVEEGGRPHPGRRHRKTLRSPARSETPCTHRHTSRENRESPWLPVGDGAADRVGKSTDVRRR